MLSFQERGSKRVSSWNLESRFIGKLREGRWKKMIKLGRVGEVHYFEHESGSVAGIKFLQKPEGR